MPDVSKRRGKQRPQARFNRMLAEVKNNQSLREELRDANKSVKLYDHNAPKVRARRRLAKREFLAIPQAQLTADGTIAESLSEEELTVYCFHKDRFVELACQYLAWIATSGG
ncbi:MAG: hypothetical protein M1837_005863 [Sclerophora amabilis]|nr:MAG: hypothetical protein M1837_005863 [Sclerophora amabilis]